MMMQQVNDDFLHPIVLLDTQLQVDINNNISCINNDNNLNIYNMVGFMAYSTTIKFLHGWQI